MSTVYKCMSKSRYLEIKRNLHFADNSEASSTSDRLFKMRPLFEIFEKNFCQWGVFQLTLVKFAQLEPILIHLKLLVVVFNTKAKG